MAIDALAAAPIARTHASSLICDAGEVACAFEELAAGGGIVPLLLIARALAMESDGHASVSHLSTCIATLAARTSEIIRTPLAPPVAAAAAAAAVQLTVAYYNRGRARLQFGWTDDAWEDFAVAGGIASSCLRRGHRVRILVHEAARQAAAAAAKAGQTSQGSDLLRLKKKRQKQKKGWACLV